MGGGDDGGESIRSAEHFMQHVLPAGAPLFAQGSVNAAFHRDLQPRQGETVVQKDNVSVFAGDSAAVIDKVLKDAGMVDEHQQGRQRLYRLNAEGIANARLEIELFLINELDDLETSARDLSTRRVTDG